MTYDPNNLWSEVEDNAVRQFYPRHGSKWAGWSEVLPNRTTRAISARAARLGVPPPPKQEPKYPRRERKEPQGDERHHKVSIVRIPDPNEKYVLACMKAGLTPTEIDRKRHWWSGTTIRILTERWARENEQASGTDDGA